MHPVIIGTSFSVPLIHGCNLIAFDYFIQTIMFNSFFQSIFTNTDICRAPAGALQISNGTASVLYKDGSIYRYTNVSRRAIIKFMLDDARSLGKFINVVLKQQRVAGEYRLSTPKYVLAN